MRTNVKISHSDLPESDSMCLEPPSAFPSSASISRLTKTLLVVNDDPMFLHSETQILRLQGYKVLEAQSAAEALRFAGETATIHLLITDFSMPQVDGLELTRRFRRVHPETPVLMVSRSLPSLRDGSEDLDRVELLARPFVFDELLRKVRTLLEPAVPFPRQKPWCCD